MTGNDRKVTARELSDKLDTLWAEQRTEHFKTRAVTVVVVAAGTGGVKMLALLGVLPGW